MHKSGVESGQSADLERDGGPVATKLGDTFKTNTTVRALNYESIDQETVELSGWGKLFYYHAGFIGYRLTESGFGQLSAELTATDWIHGVSGKAAASLCLEWSFPGHLHK